MFAGRRRIRSSNVRAMQLFHELKQQFPTVPDHIVSACIANSTKNIREVLQEAATAQNSPIQEPMGRTPPTSEATLAQTPSSSDASSFPRQTMNESDSDVNQNLIKPSAFYSKKSESVSVNASDGDSAPEKLVGKSSFYVKRPDHLDIKSDIRPSERCKDVHKLLNSDHVNEKPPRSPLSAKRFAKNALVAARSPLASPETLKRFHGRLDNPKTPSPTEENKTETAQTANTVNLSLNVNCSMDLVHQNPRRRSSVLQLTPQQPWIQEPASPRSYTSVNLTLRPPTSVPQAPIDITSQNSSLTYSTSTFDSQKGLQSRLQITVGPAGGSVSSVRTRPRSSYLPESTEHQDVVPASRAGSLPDLAVDNERKLVFEWFLCCRCTEMLYFCCFLTLTLYLPR